MIQKPITDSVAESNAVEYNVDTGLDRYSPEERGKMDLHDAAERHKKRLYKLHDLGWKRRRTPCSSCGHLICRCEDRKRRAQIEGAEAMR